MKNCKDCGRFCGSEMCTCKTDKVRREIRESMHVASLIEISKQKGENRFVMSENVWGVECHE